MKSTKSWKFLRFLLRLCLCFGVTKAVTTGYPPGRQEATPSSTDLETDTLVTDLLYVDSDSNVGATGGPTTEAKSIEGDAFPEDVTNEVISWKWTFSWSWSIIVQIIFAFVGITGNLLVVLAVARRKSSHATDILIGALATADLLSSICFIPLPRATVMPNNFIGEAYCKLIHTYFYRWTWLIASIYILAVMSCERMVAVVFPLHFHQIFSRRNVYMAIAVIWLLSPLPCFLFFFLEVRNGQCELYTFPIHPIGLNVVILTLRMIIPGAIMIVSQVITAVSLHRQSKYFRRALASHAGTQKTFHLKARNRVVQMMFIVVAVFILSWSPVQATFVLVALGYIPRSISAHVRQLGTLVTYINTMVNPVIYAARYPKFRAAVKEIFVGIGEKDTPLFNQEEQITKSLSTTFTKSS